MAVAAEHISHNDDKETVRENYATRSLFASCRIYRVCINRPSMQPTAILAEHRQSIFILSRRIKNSVSRQGLKVMVAVLAKRCSKTNWLLSRRDLSVLITVNCIS